jgi:hypothetical protein
VSDRGERNAEKQQGPETGQGKHGDEVLKAVEFEWSNQSGNRLLAMISGPQHPGGFHSGW